MKKIVCILLLMSAGIHFLNAQSSVAIGDSNPKESAVLYLKGNGSQGLIIPIVSNTNSIVTPESGMIVYNSTDQNVYYHDGATWTAIGGGSGGGSTYSLSILNNNLLLKDATSTVSTVPISLNAPSAANQFLTWNGSNWVATTFSQDATNANGAITVNGIKGKALPTLPSSIKALVYTGTAWEFQTLTGGTDSQDLILNTTTNSLSLTNDATAVDLTPYKQTLAIAGSSLSISGGNSVTLPSTTYTAGTGISITGTTIANTGDNNATDDLTTTSTAAGDVTGLFSSLQIASGAVTTTEIADGTIAAADLSAMSASNGQILKYNGTTWVPSPDDVGGGATPTLSNGQILIGNGTSNSASTLTGDAALTGGALTISNNAITSVKIADGTIAAGDLNSMSATNGQVLKFNGTNWAPAAETGTAYTGGTGISVAGTVISNTGDTNAADDLTTASTAAGDVTGLFSNLQIASGAVTTTEIADGTIAAADLGAMSASNGQILKYNGTTWVPSPDDVGGGATPTLSNGQILIGNGTSNSASTLTGDAALTGGALTISNNAITSAKIADGTIAAGDLNSMSATNGQVLKFNGTNWAPAAETGTTYTAGTGISVVGTVITNTGDTNAADDLTTASTAGGDVTGLFSNLQLASGAVSTTEIADGTIAAGDLNSMSATNGQVLKFNGTNWAPAAETTYTGGTGISVVGTVIANTGDTNAADDLTTASTSGGDLTGLFSNLQLASGAVTTTEIADGTIAGADLATNINITTTGNITTNAPGNLSIAGTSTLGGAATLTSLTGAGTRMVVANATGVLSTAAVPASGWGLTGNSATNPATNYVGTSDLQPLVFRTNATEAMRVLSDGKVGIGTSAPLTKLDVVATTTTAIAGSTSSNAAQSYAVSGIHNGTGDVAGFFFASNPAGGVNSHGVYGHADGAGSGVFGANNGTTGTAAWFQNFNAGNTNPVVKIFNTGTGPSLITAGAVGIATSTPTQPLDVVGNVKFSGALMPNNLPGVSGQVLMSAGPGVAPTWGGGGWSTTGNAGTTAGTNFIGTTDDKALEIKVNNTRVGRYELNTAPTTAGVLSPNIIQGYFQNTAAAGVKGSVISGGGLDNFHTVDGDWATIGGGRDNHAGAMAPYAAYTTVGGGASNTATGQWSTIGGGKSNVATGNATAMPGGSWLIAESFGSTVVGTANLDPAGSYTTGTWVVTEPVFIVGNGQIAGPNLVGRSNAMVVLKNGNVGIGSSTPTQILDVVGNVKFSGALMPNNLPGTAGDVLVSQGANNDPIWTAPSSSTLIRNPGTLNLFAGVGAGSSTTGNNNAIFGASAGAGVSTAINNSFFGAEAGKATTSGAENTFIGRLAGRSNLTGGFNVFVGKEAGQLSTADGNSVFVGYRAGYTADGGNGNTLIGSQSGTDVSGGLNTFIGVNAGQTASSGSNNTLIGNASGAALSTGSNVTLIGATTNVTGVFNNATAIGYGASVNAANKVRIGNASVTVIEGQVAFTAASDRRFKKDIKDIDEGLTFINKLRPVSYRMKDGDNRINWGFIAQDIESLVGTENAVLTIGGDSNRSLGLRYTDFVAPLVKSIQEQQNQIEELKKVIQDLEAKLKVYQSNENSELALIREQIKKLSDIVGMEASVGSKK